MITSDSFYVYIFSWKKVAKNTVDLYNTVSKFFPNTYIINSSKNNKLPIDTDYQIQLTNDYYYGGQFQTAINHIPQDKIIGIITGDVVPNSNWRAILKNSIDALSTDIGIYAPNLTNTKHHTGPYRRRLRDSLYHVNNTDCTCWFICPEIYTSILHIPFYNISNLGWGIDIICVQEAWKKDLHVVRDYSVKINQPKGTGYDREQAYWQMKDLLHYYNNSQNKIDILKQQIK